jgi:polysaccharide export outer membrane protein
MKTASASETSPATSSSARRRLPACFYPAALGALGLMMLTFTGCETANVPGPVDQAQLQPTGSQPSESQTVREGDVLKIDFPGAPNLDTTQQVRRDGRITLSLVGEFKAAGLTPSDLEKELIKAYSSQLVSKEVTVTVVSSSYAVFVTGAVIRPGKIMTDRPLTALEAVMEAGGFDSAKADIKAVVVIRNENGRTKNYPLNLKLVLEGKQSEPFYLKPSDIVYVPVKFSWF